jgi:hypothetical protein
MPKIKRVRKDSRRVDVKRRHLGGWEVGGALCLWGKKEHLVRRYPGIARSSF